MSTRLDRHGRRAARAAGTALVVAAAVLAAATGLAACGGNGPTAPAQGGAPVERCLYTRDGTSGLSQAARQLGVSPFRCAVIFDRAATDWTAWSRPWFVGNRIANDNWARWASTRGHRFIITLSLIPASARSQDWRALGAAGAYAGYAHALAANLVSAGLGHSVIRLSNEPNGNWFSDNLGSTATDRAQWVRFWQRTARAMLGVKGAHFAFDWTVANATGRVPLSAYYPGDRLVTYIGDDIYDNGLAAPPSERWSDLVNAPGGVAAVRAFARRHGKPFSVPEWGLAPPPLGGGDDPAFVRGIAGLAHEPGIAYEAYFFAGDNKSTLLAAPRSRAVYRKEFARG